MGVVPRLRRRCGCRSQQEWPIAFGFHYAEFIAPRTGMCIFGADWAHPVRKSDWRALRSRRCYVHERTASHACPNKLGQVQRTGNQWGFSLTTSASSARTNLLYEDQEQAEYANSKIASALAASARVQRSGSSSKECSARTPLPKHAAIRQWVHTLLEGGGESTIGRLIEGFVVVLIVVNVATVVLETIPILATRYHGFFSWFEQFSLAIFTGSTWRVSGRALRIPAFQQEAQFGDGCCSLFSP